MPVYVALPLTFPERFKLSQNYPIPFNHSTTIEFTIPEPKYVEIKIYNLLGKEVANLISNNLSAGEYHYIFNGSDLASGVYYYQLVAGEFQNVKKMVLIK